MAKGQGVPDFFQVAENGGPRKWLEVRISEQKLYLWQDHQLQGRYAISTAAAGPGCVNGSGCTPTGRHVVRAKIGAGLPAGAVLVGRRPTGETWSPQLAEQAPGRDWILSRILWLSGCEPGHNRLGNVDTMRRFIYIHGTPPDQPLGVPASHGCIRMDWRDVIEVFDWTPVGTPVEIVP